uniref:Uncharacterized protein n=1 Tax=viral metagenome TaxID=1070528 RepID=A0A6C0L046_9ZZZZ
MDQLIDSLKVSRSESSTVFYIFLTVFALCILGGSFSTYLFLKGVSIAQIQTRFPTVPVNQILYGLAASVGLMVILTLLGANLDISISRKNTGINRSLPPSTTFWKPATGQNPQDPINLRVESDEFPMSKPDIYSMAVEVSVYDSRSENSSGPYRHILHRGTDELIKFKSDVPGTGQGGLSDGLPTQMNPGIFLDKFTNDLIVFVDTDPVKSGDTGFRESVRISDIPLKKPFYVHVSVHDQILEVYVNCRLAATKLLQGSPRAVPNDWYGRIGFARAAALIQNLRLWDIDLYAFEMLKLCPPIVVLPNTAPSSCSK